MRERRIVAEFVADAVESTGGLFVSLAEDPPEFPERFVEGSRQADIPCEALDPDRVMAEEPAISRGRRRLARRAVNRSRPTGNLDIYSVDRNRLPRRRSLLNPCGWRGRAASGPA